MHALLIVAVVLFGLAAVWSIVERQMVTVLLGAGLLAFAGAFLVH